MKNKTALLALGIFLLAAFGCGTADNPVRDIKEIEITTGIIRGNIQSIDGVSFQVRLLQDEQLVSQTETKGIYIIREIEAGDYTLSISAPGYEKIEQNITVLADQTVSLERVTLVELGYPVSNITGQLSNARTGVRLEQSLILLTDENGEEYQTLTVGNGIFTFENLQVDQQYTLTIKIDGYEDKEIKVSSGSSDETVKLYVRLSPLDFEEDIEPPLPGTGLNILSEAPDFELPDGNNKIHTLTDFIEDGKRVVLVFYRGGL